MSEIKIRPACPDDAKQIGQLIYDTVRKINRSDYTEQQVEAWAPDPLIFSRFEESYAYVIEYKGLVLGFGNLTFTGYLHRFYIHKDYQGKGFGTLLLNALEAEALKHHFKVITTEASITAKPFFLAKGWSVQEKQTKILRGVSFINYKMCKTIS